MKERKKYKWYDPIIDPPLERTPEDHYQSNKKKFIGSAIGAVAGLSVAAIPYLKNHDKTPIENISKHVGRAGAYALGGASAGHMMGNVVSNYGMYKKRYDKNQEIHTKSELKRKMDHNIGPSFSMNAGPASFNY
jgi:hypothetical protein